MQKFCAAAAESTIPVGITTSGRETKVGKVEQLGEPDYRERGGRAEQSWDKLRLISVYRYLLVMAKLFAKMVEI